MGKLLIFLVLTALFIAWVKGGLPRRPRCMACPGRRAAEQGGSQGAGQANGQGAQAGARAGQSGGEAMVRCEVCGLHLPLSESVSMRWRSYCSLEHASQANP
ncbi:MAG: deaminase [Candidatus Protistobacter heckmanni]|nr:deaminase [Candidatus Protistobacter heckmanni]